MGESIKSRFKPSFPKKYKGDSNNIICRSSWERRFCNYCDINENILLQLCNTAITAGNRVLDFYDLDTEIIYKKDESPLTKADLDSNKILLSSISKITPNIPILSEEEFIAWNTRKNWKKYWLIDPLDGTKEFIKKNGEFTINIDLFNIINQS